MRRWVKVEVGPGSFQKIKLQQRQQHKLVSLLKEKNAPAHAKLKYVFCTTQ